MTEVVDGDVDNVDLGVTVVLLSDIFASLSSLTIITAGKSKLSCILNDIETRLL